MVSISRISLDSNILFYWIENSTHSFAYVEYFFYIFLIFRKKKKKKNTRGELFNAIKTRMVFSIGRFRLNVR